MVNAGEQYGKMVSQYMPARKEFPKPVFDYLWSLAGDRSGFIIDLGCGTGIPTRYLGKRMDVIGVDVDRVMIERARKEDSQNAWYVCAAASALPFVDQSFDVVTAFSAFHWFSSPDNLREIKRVLKSGGLFFVANKYDTGYFREGYRKVLSQFVPLSESTKKNFNPQLLMNQAGFGKVEEKEFFYQEDFSLHKAVVYVQSTFVWNSIPSEKRVMAAEALTEYFISQLIDHKITRKLVIRTVVGIK